MKLTKTIVVVEIIVLVAVLGYFAVGTLALLPDQPALASPGVRK